MNNTPPPGRGKRYEGNYELDVLLDKEQRKGLKDILGPEYQKKANDLMNTAIVMGEVVELTNEQFDAIQDLYVKCHSCGQYCEGTEPNVGHYMCEDCIG